MFFDVAPFRRPLLQSAENGSLRITFSGARVEAHSGTPALNLKQMQSRFSLQRSSPCFPGFSVDGDGFSETPGRGEGNFLL